MRLGISGRLTAATIASPLTPLLLIAAIAMGLLALASIPREEEPQISVPMVDIHVRADGLKAEDAVKLVTEPLETIVKSIDGVEHVYSTTRDDGALVTARFKVGTSSDAAILRVHEKIRANMDRIPVGIPEPLIVGRGISDVAIVTLTLSPAPQVAERWTDKDLYQVATELRAELMKVDNVGLSYISGGGPQQIRVEPEPEKLALHGVTLQQLVGKIRDANRSFLAGQWRPLVYAAGVLDDSGPSHGTRSSTVVPPPGVSRTGNVDGDSAARPVVARARNIAGERQSGAALACTGGRADARAAATRSQRTDRDAPLSRRVGDAAAVRLWIPAARGRPVDGSPEHSRGALAARRLASRHFANLPDRKADPRSARGARCLGRDSRHGCDDRG